MAQGHPWGRSRSLHAWRLSTHRNLRAHAQAQRLLAEVEHLMRQANDQKEEPSSTEVSEDPEERLARLRAHVELNPRDKAAAARLDKLLQTSGEGGVGAAEDPRGNTNHTTLA